MREHTGVSREELKQSAVLTAAVLLVLGLVAAWSVLIPGVNAWENIVVAVIGSLRLTGPVAAAFAAWVAVRRRRAVGDRPLTTWRAVRTPLAIVVSVVGAFAGVVLLLALCGVLTDQVGHLAASGVAMGMAGLALYVVLGWVVGWLLPWSGTPLLAGLGCYGLFAWLAERASWGGRLSPATREPYDPFQGLGTTAFTDQALWLVGISAALLLGWTALITRQALALAGALLALLVAATGVARLVSEPRQVTTEPVVYSCQEWPITICVHPGMRSGLPELRTTFTKIASRLAGTPAEFTRIEQHPRYGGPALPAGVVPIFLDDLAPGFADEAADEFLESLAKRCPGSSADGYREIVMAWLRGRPLPGGPLPEHQYAAVWFSALTETQRRDWLRMFYTDFTECRLHSRHFGGPQSAPPAPGLDAGDQPVYPLNPSPGEAATPTYPGHPTDAPIVPHPAGPSDSPQGRPALPVAPGAPDPAVSPDHAPISQAPKLPEEPDQPIGGASDPPQTQEPPGAQEPRASRHSHERRAKPGAGERAPAAGPADPAYHWCRRFHPSHPAHPSCLRGRDPGGDVRSRPWREGPVP